MAEIAIAEKLAQFKIIPVLVLNDVESGLKRCEMLCKNGLGVAEVTFRTEAAEAVIKAVSREFPEMFIGAGTILNVKDLHRAFNAGAKFAVAPGFNPTVVKEAFVNGYAFAPGICTPSEIEQGYELGCRFFKFFPAEAAGGVKMLKAISAPYKHLGIRFMPTGGVTIDNAAEWLALDVVAAAGGTWLNKADEEGIRKAAELAKSL
ncbi:MAG: bifunctional 4-hydroxy-2-oxoglutarate aldolase/2-dehydro-3-deoxy-phosphogluconate aldolase [Lentisphaeria bacterium]|mgnify:CR=1 FL=1|nr:bifunctional 4-hydroxy-2-oxoglutarate aldolase/2-dehydro-3-deoxy-phosphogluconate aldolase [Lentisphaeria bacterium]